MLITVSTLVEMHYNLDSNKFYCANTELLAPQFSLSGTNSFYSSSLPQFVCIWHRAGRSCGAGSRPEIQSVSRDARVSYAPR